MKIVICETLDTATRNIIEEAIKDEPDIEICENKDLLFVDFSSHMVPPFKIKESPQLMLSSIMEDKQKFKRYHYKKLILKGRRR